MSDNKDIGRVASQPGSREPSPDGLGPSGFDPSRIEFLQGLRDFNRTWGIPGEPTLEQVSHMLAIFGLEFVPLWRSANKRPVRSTNGGSPKPGTIQDAVLQALEQGPSIMKELRVRVSNIRGHDVPRTSLAPQLSRLRAGGAISLTDGVWSLASRDRDRSGEAGETGTGSTEGKSLGPKGIAQKVQP